MGIAINGRKLYNNCKFKLIKGYGNKGMLTIYNLIASIFGDNKKGKMAYKLIRLIAPSLVLAYFIYKVFSRKFTVGTGIALLVWLAVFAVYYIYVLKDDMKNLHAFPNIKGVDLQGAKIRYDEPNREKMFKIIFENDCEIEARYETEAYVIRVKNDEWQVIREDSTDAEGFKSALAAAVEFAKAQPMPPKGQE